MKIILIIICFNLLSCSTILDSTINNKEIIKAEKTINAKEETVYKTVEIKREANLPNLNFTPETEVSNGLEFKNIQSKDENHLANMYSSNLFKNNYGFEMSTGAGNWHTGFNFGFLYNEMLALRVGGSIFASESWYLGFDLSGRIIVPWSLFIKPYFGIGMYLGDSKKCETNYTGGMPVDNCEKKFLDAEYTEFGAQYSQFDFFYRNYRINRAGIILPSNRFMGIGIRIPI